MRTETPTSESHPDLPVIVLASSSPRRRELLTSAGIEHRVRPAQIDDGELEPGEFTSADQWVVALAYLKAISSSRLLQDEDASKQLGECTDGQIVIIGADTVCVHDGQIIGQPRDRDHAREIIKTMSGATHEVLTGVAILEPKGDRRELFVDRSVVTVGEIPEDQIEVYLDSMLWQGKAGAYNISERLAAGWPIEFTGDENSIVGLPLSRVVERVASFYLD